ncbi:MAG: adenylyl-sulfate kinase [Clostridiaceae bacterium]|nr:adenylyl-sulfate kinase [Clostridiaceae bacterium]
MEKGNITFHHGKVNCCERYKILGQKGLVVWLTGLSASGKSTIAAETERRLIDLGRAVYRLDGDNIRFGLNSDLGFSEKDRFENIRRVAEVCALFKDAGLIVIASFISPLSSMRQMAREKAGDNFLEVYVKASVEVCAERDPKGLYERAFKGEIKDFTGVSAPYEEPEKPDIILDTEKYSQDKCVERLTREILGKSALKTVKA